MPPAQVRDLLRSGPVHAPDRLRLYRVRAGPGGVQEVVGQVPKHVRRHLGLAVQARLQHDHLAHRAGPVCARRRLRRRGGRRLQRALVRLQGAHVRGRRLLPHRGRARQSAE